MVILLILIIMIIGTVTGHDFKCPTKAEWKLRANVSCYSEDKYVCLLNILEDKYMENCLGSDRSSIGSKLVFQPLFNLAECDAQNYQPIVFTTHGNSKCIYSKSKCSEEGQVIFNNGSASADTACRCDYTKGYAFVKRPKNSCFCKPSEEDCSCYKAKCKKLSTDYQCITDGEILVNATCQEILPSLSYNTDNNTVQLIESNRNSYSHTHHVADIILASIAVYIVFAVIVLLKVCVFVPPEILSQEIFESDGDEGNIGLKCYVRSYLPLTSMKWFKEPGESMFINIKSNNVFSRNGIKTLTFEIPEKDNRATYKCIASNKFGTVESDPIQLNVSDDIPIQMNGNETTVADDIFPQINGNDTTDEERQKFIRELFLKGECGKLHFARLVFIGKKGVGKTSLMRRLLWQNKEDVTSTESTDGIEIEKCNINIDDGKWSPRSKIDDDLTRLIHQVYKEKSRNVGCAAETVLQQEPHSSNTDELTVSEILESMSTFNLLYSLCSNTCDNIGMFDTFNYHNKRKSDESDDTVGLDFSRPDIDPVISDNKDNQEAVETVLNKIQPDDLPLENTNDNEISNYTNENASDPAYDEKINEMTSTIMKSCVKFWKEEQDDTLAFCWLWDFAGQKDFYATHQVFLSKYAVFLLVTDSLEFSTAENQGMDFEDSAQYVSFWFDAIHCYWSTANRGRLDPPIIVVCTKEDQFKEPLEREKRQKEFIENLGQVLKDQKKKDHLRNIYFISNTEDADIVFDEIRKDISRQAMAMQDWGKDFPLKWLLFQEVLLKLKDSNVPISPTETLLKIAKHEDINISEDNEVKKCLQYCHDIGTVVYFDEENLSDHVILDPKWLINAFRCLVSDKIENIIEVSDDWQKLKDTGQLTDSLISRLFMKEPELKFEENKAHLIEVMKRFDIIVTLRNAHALYMPCMMKSCSFLEIQKHFYDGSQSFYKTSWLCLEFKFLPPAFFNHIIAWYIKQYQVSVIIDKKCRSERNALYRQVGVFDLDPSGCEQLVVCEGRNVIALQVWDSRKSNKTYGDLGSKLFRFVETLRNRYSLRISYTITFTCTDGDFTIKRRKIEDLVTREYRCLEHKTHHLSDDLVKPWNFSEKLQKVRTSKMEKERPKTKKMVVIGDHGVGKTCFLTSYTTNAFPGEIVPRVCDSCTVTVNVDGIPYTVQIWDTAGEEDYDRLRPLSYPMTDIMLLCFSVIDRSSLENIESKWLPDKQHFVPNAAQVLVGCKADLRDTNPDTCITTSEAEAFAIDHNLPYCETSALNQIGLEACFETAIIESTSIVD